MLSKYKSYRAHHEGFTIIEVIIVLVIGTIIMGAVFLVVPQLQRTQRNSRRQADARRVLAAAEQSAANNGGTYPAADTAGVGKGLITNITGTIVAPSGNEYTWAYALPAAGSTQYPNDTLYYTNGSFTCDKGAATAVTNSGKIVVIVASEDSTGTNKGWCVGN